MIEFLLKKLTKKQSMISNMNLFYQALNMIKNSWYHQYDDLGPQTLSHMKKNFLLEMGFIEGDSFSINEHTRNVLKD